MKIIVDAMGGDNAPEEIVKGSMMAVSKLGVEVILVGNNELIKKYLTDDNGIGIIPAGDVISCDEDPVKAIRTKPDSSMAIGDRKSVV